MKEAIFGVLLIVTACMLLLGIFVDDEKMEFSPTGRKIIFWSPFVLVVLLFIGRLVIY